MYAISEIIITEWPPIGLINSKFTYFLNAEHIVNAVQFVPLGNWQNMDFQQTLKPRFAVSIWVPSLCMWYLVSIQFAATSIICWLNTVFIIHTLMRGVLSEWRRYLALCVGETRVRIDLLEPVTPRLPQSPRKDNEGKLPLSPSTLHFLSQVHQLTSSVQRFCPWTAVNSLHICLWSLTVVCIDCDNAVGSTDTSQAPDLCSISFSVVALPPYWLH